MTSTYQTLKNGTKYEQGEDTIPSLGRKEGMVDDMDINMNDMWNNIHKKFFMLCSFLCFCVTYVNDVEN